jgi:hypothetical protein
MPTHGFPERLQIKEFETNVFLFVSLSDRGVL